MKKHLPLILTATFLLVTVVCISKSVGLARETAMLRLQIAAKQQQAQIDANGPAEVQTYEVVTVRQAVDGIAWHYHLPLTVEQKKNTLKIAPVKITDVQVDSKVKDYPVLRDYESLLGFLSAVSTLPYKLEIKELCIGGECPEGFSMSMEIKAKS